MKTIKLIDLLNKIANDEDTPNAIKFNNKIFTHNGTGLNHNYYCGETDEILEENFILSDLNDEVEIIEDTPKEDKKIEKISLDDWDEFTTPGDIKRIDYMFNKNCSTFVAKINEIIETLNKKQ